MTNQELIEQLMSYPKFATVKFAKTVKPDEEVQGVVLETRTQKGQYSTTTTDTIVLE